MSTFMFVLSSHTLPDAWKSLWSDGCRNDLALVAFYWFVLDALKDYVVVAHIFMGVFLLYFTSWEFGIEALGDRRHVTNVVMMMALTMILFFSSRSNDRGHRIIVHDLKTPLWSIMHAFESVRDHLNGTPGGTQQESESECMPMLQAGLASAVYMQNLAMNLLEVARLKFSDSGDGGGDEGTVQLACGINSVWRCLDSVGEMMKPAGSVKGVNVEIVDARRELHENFGTLEGMAWFDETRLLQYTKGGGSVTVRLLSEDGLTESAARKDQKAFKERQRSMSMQAQVNATDPVGNQEAEAVISAAGLMCGRLQKIVIEIQDTGRGIPQSKMKEIWCEYSQVKVQDAAVGSGLGLSIVKAIMKAMGGTAEISSEEGVGTSLFLSVIVRALVPTSLGSLAISGSPNGSLEVRGRSHDNWSLLDPVEEGQEEEDRADERVLTLTGMPGSRLNPIAPVSSMNASFKKSKNKGPKAAALLTRLGSVRARGKRKTLAMAEAPDGRVWEALRKHSEAGRKQEVWDRLLSLTPLTLSAMLVEETSAAIVIVDDQPMMLSKPFTCLDIVDVACSHVLKDIARKVGFPPERTLAYEDSEVAVADVVALVGGPLPSGQMAAVLEGVRAVLLLTDMQMGDMSGLSLARQVREGAVAAGAVVGPFPPPPGTAVPSSSSSPEAAQRSAAPFSNMASPALHSSSGSPRAGGSPRALGGGGVPNPLSLTNASTPSKSFSPRSVRGTVHSHESRQGPLQAMGLHDSRSSQSKTQPQSPKAAAATADAQWAVRVSAPPTEPPVLRCCLLSAQIRGGILERHPEAETVTDAVLEKPLYPADLAMQLRLLAAAALSSRRPVVKKQGTDHSWID
uniref:histidine kinase n=1 Tax=Chromera velia CCMP2878 TaxID=1169474 RepID=A0A0G4IEZ4_9ALVE|eukprot:Cvel_13905.t1-p1 / transcript=Cvel_13905.t1 / gene=Cvel_13905 / organism=Chromera_velia_CCMP2878 / gene_product=Sensor histidine kinase YclK, putative / transcript_product=Sensor histidine kinase YclK, putative / location=Cvel_scaffold969:8762-17205(-) / protein_length=851 / sequence_SO=supercontig / SO=protein_coding / is_pseudo=false